MAGFRQLDSEHVSFVRWSPPWLRTSPIRSVRYRETDRVLHPCLIRENRTGRAPGSIVRTVNAVLPGVARVWDQLDHYADAWHASNIRTVARSGRRWIVLGDSMSQCIGASAYDAGWVGQLSSRLAARGHHLDIVNFSATGARTSDVLHQQLPALDDLGVREHDLVTVMVGSNDLFAGRSQRAALPSTYAELIDRLPIGAAVATLPQPAGAARRANAHVEKAAATGRIVMVDLRVSGPSSWRGRLAADFFHPNDAGYAAIATAFEPSIESILA